MNPANKTLFPVPTWSRVETLPRLPGVDAGVAVGVAVAPGVDAGVAVGVGVPVGVAVAVAVGVGEGGGGFKVSICWKKTDLRFPNE